MNSNVNISSNVRKRRNEPLDVFVWMAEQKDIFGAAESREEVLKRLRRDGGSYRRFKNLSQEFQEEFLLFCMGKRGLKITYDPVFKMIFNPETKLGRLEEFLSLCLGERVEIQRLGYLFPGERCACYSSDLMMRQYSQVKRSRKEEGVHFSYKDIKKVYTIVLIQRSTNEFHDSPREHLHYARQTFNTGLKLDMLQEYLLIPLDVFLEANRKISSKLEAWLYFIASDKPEDIKKVIEAYPEFKEMYKEVFHFRYKKKELLGMYSKALQLLDLGTVEYMVEQQREELERNKIEMSENKKKLRQNRKKLRQNRKELSQSRKELSQNREELEKMDNSLRENKYKIELQQKEIERLKALLKQQGETPD